jgi:hypothetical protein
MLFWKVLKAKLKWDCRYEVYVIDGGRVHPYYTVIDYKEKTAMIVQYPYQYCFYNEFNASYNSIKYYEGILLVKLYED